MKNIISHIFFLAFSIILFAQPPQGIDYQGIVRDLIGHPLINQNINIRPSIMDGSVAGTCVATQATIDNATSSGSAICSTTDTSDIWFKITKPAGISDVLITTTPAACQSVSGTTVEVYSACGTAIVGSCALTGSSANFGEVTISRGTCLAEILYIRVTPNENIGGKFNICIQQGVSVGTLGSTCSNPQ